MNQRSAQRRVHITHIAAADNRYSMPAEEEDKKPQPDLADSALLNILQQVGEPKAEEDKKPRLDNLPNDLFFNVLQLVGAPEAAASVNKALAQQIDPHFYWQKRFQRTFPRRYEQMME